MREEERRVWVGWRALTNSLLPNWNNSILLNEKEDEGMNTFSLSILPSTSVIVQYSFSSLFRINYRSPSLSSRLINRPFHLIQFNLYTIPPPPLPLSIPFLSSICNCLIRWIVQRGLEGEGRGGGGETEGDITKRGDSAHWMGNITGMDIIKPPSISSSPFISPSFFVRLHPPIGRERHNRRMLYEREVRSSYQARNVHSLYYPFIKRSRE